MSQRRCKRCHNKLEEDEPSTIQGLCCSCHEETRNPNACCWCGERKKIDGGEYCLECRGEVGECFGQYENCDPCSRCELREVCEKHSETDE